MQRVVQSLFIVGLTLLVLGLQSCVKNDCTDQEIVYMSYEPVYMSEADFKNAVQLNTPQDLENPGKIYIYDKYLLVNEIAQGIHIFDNSNPSSPQAVAFLAAPGNYDIAVNCDKLYLDSSTDLLVFDFVNPERPALISRIEDAFPHNLYFRGFRADESQGKVVNWIMEMKREQFDCTIPTPDFMVDNRLFGVALETSQDFNAQSTASRSAAPSSSTGIAGSTARFATVASSLYVLSPHELKVYDIEVCEQPNLTHTVTMNLWGGEAETIFPKDDRLFIGSTTGMFIFDNSNPKSPVEIGSLQHGTACDPVVAEDDFAYVTLRSTNGGPCAGFTNELQVVNISDPSFPQLATVVEMDGPQGLSVDGNLLFVCDGASGLRVLDVNNPNNPREMARFASYQATDVIAYDGNLIMVGEEGLAMYSYDQAYNVEKLGVIPVR